MPESWLIVQYVTSEEQSPRLGILQDETIKAAPREWPTTSALLLDEWGEWEPALRSLNPDDLDTVQDAELVAPITYPRKVLCSGANYYTHAAEMGTKPPDPDGLPFFFLKPPTTTIVGPEADVPLPYEDGANVDWEAELGVVIGRRGRRIDVSDARSHVAGYVVANDLSARGLFPRENAVFPPFAWDWLRHKAFDASCPIGPGILPAWFAPDIEERRMTLSVNGDGKQDTLINDMVVGIDKLVAGASRMVTLEPGDLILTGTPGGVGMPKGTFLKSGDVVAVEIEGIGRITNTMVEAVR